MALTPEHAAKRRSGIGGSDLEAIMHKYLAAQGDSVFGCPRKLFYDKTGVEPDYEFEETAPIERGNYMEPIIAELYSKRTGRKVRRMDHKTGKNQPWEMVSIDRQIVGDNELGVGILECKSVGQNVWYEIKTKGLPLRFVIQVQWGFHVLGPQYKWGDDAVHWGDGWQFHAYRVERDQELIDMLAKEVAAFWAMVQAGTVPERLDWSDKRCQECIFRRTCQGKECLKAAGSDMEEFADIEMDDALAPKVKTRMELFNIIKEADERKTEMENDIKTAMDEQGVDIIFAGGHKMTWLQQKDGKTVDGKKLKAEKPEVYEDYSKVRKGARPLKFSAV